MKVIEVPLVNAPYRVCVGVGLIGQVGELASGVVPPCRCAVVTDSNVGPLHGDALLGSLRGAGYDPVVLTVEAGEASKRMGEVERLCEEMIQAGLDRGSAVFALGGGVVGDLAGFVAAVFYRGVPHVQVPTTVVAQVDSAIGGKTGVNARGGKNLIGAFHQPRLVVADPAVLGTLPPREFNEGHAEIIKHAAIRDAGMLDALDNIEALVPRNIAIKAAIVAEDEFETAGVRALLNFGHTIGHGIEAAAGYGALLHGEAISLGLVAACRLSVARAGLPVEEAERVVEALGGFDLPLRLPSEISTGAVVEALKHDKKFLSGKVRFVLLERLGVARVDTGLTIRDLEEAVEGLR
jgi:3-dehydroquinate synthase